MSFFMRLIGALLVLLPSTAFADAVRIHSRTVPLHHMTASKAIETLHWAGINDLPAGIVDVEAADGGRALHIEGTQAGIDGAVQELKLVDVPVRRIRVQVTFAECRRRARIRHGRKTPLAVDARAASFRIVDGDSPLVENNGEFDVDVHRDVSAGVHLSAQAARGGSVTVRGTIVLSTLLQAFRLKPADSGSIGQVQLVRTLVEGRWTMIGEYRATPLSKGAKPIYLYVLMTARVQD